MVALSKPTVVDEAQREWIEFMNSVESQEAEYSRKPTLQDAFDLSDEIHKAGLPSLMEACDRFGSQIGYSYKLFPTVTSMTLGQVKQLTLLLREHKATKRSKK